MTLNLIFVLPLSVVLGVCWVMFFMYLFKDNDCHCSMCVWTGKLSTLSSESTCPLCYSHDYEVKGVHYFD